MFKLIKIQNSGRNVPELEKLRKLSHIKIKAGEAIILDDGDIASCPATVVPPYIAFADADENCSNVVCYPVSKDIIFETTVKGDPRALLVGYKVTIGTDSEGNSTCVTSTTDEGIATIVSLDGATKTGDKITVRF